MFYKSEDIKFSAHEAILEWPSSGTLKAKINWKPNNYKKRTAKII